MSTVSTVSNGNGGSGMSSSTANSVQALSKNYELFLSILTAQLKNQNPLDPTDTDEMTSQLINYSQVEQQILGNAYLENLVLATNNQSAAVAISMVGMEVTYNAGDLAFEPGKTLSWAFEVPSESKKVVAQIVDENDKVVYSEDIGATSGDRTFQWTGLLSSGKTASSGDYSLKVIATDAAGKTAELKPKTTSKVSQVDWSGGSAQLTMANGATVALSDVVSAKSPTTTNTQS